MWMIYIVQRAKIYIYMWNCELQASTFAKKSENR